MGGVLAKCNCTATRGNEDVQEPSSFRDVNVIDLTLETDQEYNTTEIREESSKGTICQFDEDLYRVFLLETLNSFRQQGRFTDLAVEVNGKDFPVHRNVLAASCTFFKDFVAKSDTSPAVCCELANVDPTTMESLLNFVYTGKCKLDERNASSILHAAEILGMQNLVEASMKYLLLARDPASEGHLFYSQCEESLVAAIKEFQVQGQFCDIVVTTASGRVVPTHKNILAAVSCFFQALIRSDMKEVHENKVDLEVIDEAIVEELLDFIYTGTISISFDNVENLLQASDYLLIEHLKRKIIKFLTSSLTVSNFWRVFSLVRTFRCIPDVNKEVIRVVCDSFLSIAESDEFLHLSAEDLRWFLSNDDILASEALVLESLIRWYKHDSQQREESFRDLLHLIHMSNVPDNYLKFLAEKEGVDELLSFSGHKLKAEVPLEDIKKTAHFYNLVLVGLVGSSYGCFWLPFAGPWSYIGDVQRYRNLWAEGTPLLFTHEALFMPAYLSQGSQLAIYKNPLSVRHFVQSGITPNTSSVTESSWMLTQNCAAVMLLGCVYLIGGSPSWVPSRGVYKTVQRYDVQKELWEMVSEMFEQRFDPSAATYKSRFIYVFGGVDVQDTYKSTTEMYDVQTDRWSYVASMPHPRFNAWACVCSDKIFLIGGKAHRCLSCPEVALYNPLTDEWQVLHLQINKAFPLRGCKDVGSFSTRMCDEDTGNDVKPTTSVSDRLGLPFHASDGDYAKFDQACTSTCVSHPSATVVSGFVVVFDFGSFQSRLRRLPFYLVDPESANFRVLYSLSSWPNHPSRGVIMPLSRGDMNTALRDYPGNKPFKPALYKSDI